MAISDLVLGNTMIMIFTWSGFALIALFGTIIKRRVSVAGLMRSYIMGLPFLRLHAVTSVLFLTLSVSLIEIILAFKVKRGIRLDSGAVPQL